MAAQERQQMPLAGTRVMPARNQPCQERTVLEKPMRAGAESRQSSEDRSIEDLHGKERYQADQRAHPQWNSLSAGEVHHIVIEFVLIIPQADAITADVGHCFGDIEKMFEKFGGNVFVYMIGECQFEGNAHQIERVHRHPSSAVGLVDVTSARQRCVAVEYADIVESQKSALENIPALDVLAVHPPGEVEHQLMEDTLEKVPVTFAAMVLPVDFIDAPRRPSMHRRIDVTKCPFVGGKLAIGVHIPVARKQQQLVLGKARIEQR